MMFFSQNIDEQLVKKSVNKLFLAMKNSDSVELADSFSKTAVLQTITRTGEIKNETVAEFANSIGRSHKNDLDERIEFEAVHIAGNLAAVWAPYQFYYKGNFSHCGVNSFQLIKENGVWKIQYIIDTRKKENCK